MLDIYRIIKSLEYVYDKWIFSLQGCYYFNDTEMVEAGTLCKEIWQREGQWSCEVISSPVS